MRTSLGGIVAMLYAAATPGHAGAPGAPVHVRPVRPGANRRGLPRRASRATMWRSSPVVVLRRRPGVRRGVNRVLAPASVARYQIRADPLVGTGPSASTAWSCRVGRPRCRRPVRRCPGDAPPPRVDVGPQRRDRGGHPDEDSGIGVRALVGSSWGFFAVPDLGDAACAGGRRPRSRPRAPVGERAEPGRPLPVDCGDGILGERVPGRSARCRRCPTRATCWSGDATMTEHGADLAEATYQVWDTQSGSCRAKGTASTNTSGSAAPGSWPPRSATARRSAARTRRPGAVRHTGWEFIDALDLDAHAARIAEEARALLSAPPCPAARPR